LKRRSAGLISASAGGQPVGIALRLNLRGAEAMTLAETLRRGRLARARGAVAEPAEGAPAEPAAAAHPETGGAGSEPSLRDWIGVLAMGTGLFMAIMDVQIVTSSLTQIQGGVSASTDEVA